MNFIKAIQHATIGYGIRRQSWPDCVRIMIDDNIIFGWPLVNCDTKLPFNLRLDDMYAEDWETI